MKKTTVCGSCGATFDDTLPKCPYCGNMNYNGAEAQYLHKLEQIHENMEALKETPKEAVKGEIKKQGGILVKTLLATAAICIILFSLFFLLRPKEKQDYNAYFSWKETNFPLMDEMYENEDYAALLNFWEQAVKDDLNSPIWDWDHADFYNIYIHVDSMLTFFNDEASDQELSELSYTLLLFDELTIIGTENKTSLDEEETKKLEPYVKMAKTDFDARWNMSTEQKADFLAHIKEFGGVPNYDACNAYIKKWMVN